MQSNRDRDKQPSITERFDTLAKVGMAILSEYDQSRMLKTIAQAACDLTGASFAAFSLRPVDDDGRPIVPPEGSRFSLAAIVGVSKQEEAILRRIHLGGQGFLAPIFRYGVPVLVDDVTAYKAGMSIPYSSTFRDNHPLDFDAAYGPIPKSIDPVGYPIGHPFIRSFLGVPLLSREKEVVGGLLLGDPKPNKFNSEDEALIVGLAAQSIIALENARFYEVVQQRKVLLKNYQIEKKQRAAFRFILDEIPGSIFIVQGHDAKLIFGNRSSHNFWNSPWYLGQSFFDFLHENNIHLTDDKGKTLAKDEYPTSRALRKNETVRFFQASVVYADSTTVPVLVSAIPVNRPELDNLKNEIIFGADMLEPTVIVIHQDARALKEQERMKDEFIGIAAHELKTPLAILRGFAQTLYVQTDRGYGSSLEDWQLEAIQGIEQATNRLTELTEDLLDVTRLQAGRLSLHIEPCDLLSLTQRVYQRSQVLTQKHELALHAPFDYMVVNADGHRVEQVLTNLIGNAIKYSPNGGTISVSLTEDRADPAHPKAKVSISDQGIGIPIQQQAYMFRRFMRADNARSIGGTGLGLYLCRALIEQQDGEIWFESVENEGTTFHFTLPLYIEDETTL